MKLTSQANSSTFKQKLFILTFSILSCIQVISAQDTLVDSAEAESGVKSGGVTISTTVSGYSGTGYVTNFTNSTDKITVTVNVPTKAYYKIVIRYCAPWGNKSESVYVNANSGTTSVAFASNTTFDDVNTGNYLLNAGDNTITLQSDWGWVNIDKFSVFSVPIVKHIYNINPNPVNPNANGETKKLYSFLVSNFNNKIISGQTDNYYDNIKTITGKSPLLRDFDFQHYTQGYSYLWKNGGFAFGAEDSGQTQLAIDWYNQTGKKGIVAFQWHWHSPSDGTVGTNTFYTANTTFDVTKAVTTGTTENTLILQDIDAIAAQLKKLQTAGVPVLFRPLHEASGTWFWWGAKGPAACVSLYNILYDRMTNYNGLNNLIWVWSSPEAAWYPGNTKMDIVGHDSYPGAYIYDVKKNDFDLLYTLTNGEKLIAMTENGPIPDPTDCFTLDAPWSYFMSWGDLVTSQNSNQHIIDAYSNPNVLTLETTTDISETPSDKTIYSFYPNPAKGNVAICGPDFSRLEVLDMSGKTIYSVDKTINSIQTENLKNGIYIIRVFYKNQSFQQKLTIAN